MFVYARTIKCHINKQMFAQHSSAQKVTFTDGGISQNILCFFFLVDSDASPAEKPHIDPPPPPPHPH